MRALRRPIIIFGRSTRALAVVVVLMVMVGLVASVFYQGSAAVLGQMNRKYKVVVDAGHGGYDPGAITKEGVYEKEINLAMAKQVKKLLEQAGFEIILTREEDVDYAPEGVRGRQNRKQADLNYRISLAVQEKADALISLHLNATPSGRNTGAETFYFYESIEGKNLAESIQKELVKVPEMNRRIAKPGDFYLLRKSPMPAVIVELGYISNPKEFAKLKQPWYQEQLAQAVAKGVANYFGLP